MCIILIGGRYGYIERGNGFEGLVATYQCSTIHIGWHECSNVKCKPQGPLFFSNSLISYYSEKVATLS